MIPIKGIVEIVEIDLLSSRRQMVKQGFSGLGPPDLVVVKKTDPISGQAAQSSHHVAGISIASPSSFPAYFAQLLDDFGENKKSKLTEGLFCCWNSFAEVDIHTLVCNPGSCSYYAETPNGKNYKISDLTWRELSICTILRFWRGVDPLFSSLFDIHTMCPPALNLKKPPLLAPDDIRFAVAAHPMSDELEISLAHCLIAMADPELVMDLVSEFAHRMPRILLRILMYCPPRSPLSRQFSTLLTDVVTYASDDVSFVFSLVCLKVSSTNCDRDELEPFIPLLLASLWNEPLAGIALAKLSLLYDRHDDSLLFLNASSVAVTPSWKSPVVYMPHMPVTKSKTAPRSEESTIENELMISPLSGPAFHLYRTIADVIRDLGSVRIQAILKHKPYSTKIDPSKIPRDSIYPTADLDEYISTEMNPSEFAFLLDPGVTGEPQVPRLVKYIPMTQQLLDAIQLVLNDLQTAETFRKNPEFSSDFEALKTAILGLRLGDFQLADAALSKVKEHSGMSDLLRVRLMCETDWTTFTNVFHPETKKTTINEHNALTIARALFDAFSKLSESKSPV